MAVNTAGISWQLCVITEDLFTEAKPHHRDQNHKRIDHLQVCITNISIAPASVVCLPCLLCTPHTRVLAGSETTQAGFSNHTVPTTAASYHSSTYSSTEGFHHMLLRVIDAPPAKIPMYATVKSARVAPSSDSTFCHTHSSSGVQSVWAMLNQK